MKFLFFIVLGVTLARANSFSGQLNAEDQKYYKNESMAGMNQLERIDSTVKEINKVYAEMASLKTEVGTLKSEVVRLKSDVASLEREVSELKKKSN